MTMQNTSQPEESYCSPWDLKSQEEKFLQASASKTNVSNHPRSDSPPARPPLPPGGLVSFTSQCCNPTENIDPDDDSEPLSFQDALLCFQQLTSESERQTPYDKPWDIGQGALFTRQSESLRKISKIPIFPPLISSRHRTSSLEDQRIKTPSLGAIERYFWFHFGMSRRQAETILQSRPPGSFLVRQSESGNQKDYSLSIRTDRHCVHMRISYSSGVYILGECSRPFASVPQMIDYFSQTSVPIRGATHMKLSKPVLRCELLSSSLNKN